MTAVVLALFLGALIGLSIGALGGGGSILAVPVLVYLLGESPAEATTGSLVVVAVTSVIAASTAYRAGNVLLARGVVFGVVAIGGTAVGARAAAHVDEDILMASFAALLIIVGTTMAWRQRPDRSTEGPRRHVVDDPASVDGPSARVRQAVGVLLTATAVGLLTGFLGVGGGFLVVPALLLVLALPMRYAVGTALVAIAITSAAALALRVGAGIQPDWTIVLALTGTSAIGGFAGARLAARIDAKRLTLGFTVLVLSVAAYTAARAVPALF